MSAIGDGDGLRPAGLFEGGLVRRTARPDEAPGHAVVGDRWQPPRSNSDVTAQGPFGVLPVGQTDRLSQSIGYGGSASRRQGLRPTPARRHGAGGLPDAGGSGSQGFHAKHALQEVRGLYLVKFAVSLTACYLGIQLLSTFAEVLLPFIFAVLCMMILDPLKAFIMRVLQRLVVKASMALGLKVCLEQSSDPARDQDERFADRRFPEGGAPLYGRLPQDSPAEDSGPGQAEQQAAEPAPGLKKAILALSILLCMLLTGRALWLTAKVFVRAGMTISDNLEYYKQGADRLKRWFRTYIYAIHIEALDYNKLLDGLVTELEHLGTVVTENVLYTALQAIVTFIFLIYMLWSPIKMESSTTSREVFGSTARYLKVKCLISALTGVLVAATLWTSGLDLPAAFGLLAFLANFLPGIGSFASSVLPCILAAIDVRKTPTQVSLAFACQVVVHFIVDFLVEPVFFGISVEIHSVIVILGIWFFYQVWGVPGMFLSIPLLAVIRITMRSMKRAADVGGSARAGEDQDAIAFVDNILEGRWMSNASTRRASDEELEMHDFSISSKEPPFGHAGAQELQGEGSEAAQAGLWTALLANHAVQEVAQMYQRHSLLADCALLLLLTALTIFAPL